jgi:hypothetical protein
MAIDFNCPHCNYAYRLKDEYAGKRATCKGCRNVITIPKPVTVPEDLEAAAISALADEPPKQQEEKPADKVIEMTCVYCEHKWTEPLSKAGKNTLCPNPECRQRAKVPELKDDQPQDWRQQKSKLPTLAKQRNEKLEGVQDAADSRYAGPEALKQAGADGIEIEPRTLKEKLTLVFLVVGIIGCISGGIWYLMSSRKSAGDDRLMADARAQFDQSAKEFAPAEVGVSSAVLYGAQAEYAYRKNDPKELKSAHDSLAKAREELRKQPPGPERNVVTAELAAAIIGLGGTEEEIKTQVRCRWQPDSDTRLMKVNDKVPTVHDELRQTLGLLMGADFDYKIGVARRLTRELVKKGQAGFATDLIPMALFNDLEKDEARAVIALEIYRLDRNSPVARKTAEELKAKLAAELKSGKITSNPYPASAQVLFNRLEIDKAPKLVDPPTRGKESISDATRMAQVGNHLLKDEHDEAVKVALRPGDPASQLRSLLLCAEWMPSPAAAIEEARKIIGNQKGKRDANLPPALIFRLSQIAAASGWADPAREIADSIADEGFRTWARAEALRLRLLLNPREKAEDTSLEIPEDPKRLRVGHVWGKMWVARRNASLTHDRNAETKGATSWSGPIRPFVLAGAALGLQDQ